MVIADNADELERLDRFARDAGRRQPVLVRVTPGVEGHTHAYVDTGGAHSKFGTPIAEGLALQAIKQASVLPGLEFRGIHAHVGSQLLTHEPFLEEIDVLLDLLAEIRDSLGLEVAVLDIGGGFGAVYTDEQVPDLRGGRELGRRRPVLVADGVDLVPVEVRIGGPVGRVQHRAQRGQSRRQALPSARTIASTSTESTRKAVPRKARCLCV